MTHYIENKLICREVRTPLQWGGGWGRGGGVVGENACVPEGLIISASLGTPAA